MQRFVRFGGFSILHFVTIIPLFAQAVSNPKLTVRQAGAGQIQVSWPATATGFVLEATDAVSAFVTWQPVNTIPTTSENEFAVTLTGAASNRFFRLRQGVSQTSITATSPVNGETGVAVTRETIVHFSGPLAANAVIKTNNFYATAAGRRILSRIELSSERTKATLFYLEPLPGSTRVNVFFDGEGLMDFLGQPLDPAGTGQANGLKVISFETLTLTPLEGTAMIGRVFASELMPGSDTGTNAVNRPLEGVTITVDGREQDLRTTTDALGNFTLAPVPPGRFFVKIDGRTARGSAYPNGAYYPYVGKAWDAVAGRTNNLAGGTGEIFLPLITPGTLQPVSMTQDTPISFPSSVVAANPALAGVTILVPANSLFSDDGTRGGKVGIAPVPPDRLPGPLPPGLEMPIVITVQTDGGLNFDKPAPICFPNLPDPVLKTPLPANSKQALISFNHDKGIWEAVGSMTVSADGKFICTDPGAGILQPGWHGVGPDPDEPPPCDELCCDGGGGGGGGGPGPLGGGSGFARTGKTGPPPAQCKEPCKGRKKEEECREQCAKAFRECMLFAARAGERCFYGLRFRVDTVYDAPGDCGPRVLCVDLKSKYTRQCLDLEDQCYAIRNTLEKGCYLDLRECIARCHNDCPNPVAASRRLAKAGLIEDLIAAQILEKLDVIDTLFLPYRFTDLEMPKEVGSQIEALRADVDALAGGDTLQFLERYLLSLEEERLADDVEFGEDPGNAPPYPVLYAAEIARGTNSLTLRAETGPFGQYSIFVPRDGRILFMSFYDPRTKRIGTAFPNLRPDAPYRMPRFNLHSVDETLADSDRDGLLDAVEFIYGTDETVPDSDGDGIFDGAEIDQGTNPLDGQPVRIGIVGTAKTPGSAVDVAAANDLLAVAEGTSGVSVFNIFNGMSPVLIAHVDTPGTAQGVAMSGNFVAVADGEYGLAIIDLSDPANAQIVHQVPLGLSAQSVAAAGNFAYVVLSNPRVFNEPAMLVKVDLVVGIETDRVPLGRVTGSPDVAVAGDHVYVLTPTSLLIFGEANGSLALLGQLAVTSSNARQLFVGGGLAYAGQGTGYSVIDVTNPATPVLVGVSPTAQMGLEYPVTTGSGLLVATTVMGRNSQQVALYDASQPSDVTRLLTLFDTPGEARALTIHNGLGYVADSAAGIQVINYLPFDKNKVAPTISLSTSAEAGVAEVSMPLRVTANATDDVQVRSVEFYIDGQNVFSDGNFPFEHRFIPPPLTAIKTNITLRARAIDTGGNFTWSEELTIKLGPDVTPPRIAATTPLGGAKVVSSLFAYFSEPMNPVSLGASSFQLVVAGPDGLFDTPDDLPVGGGGVSYHSGNLSVSLDFAAPLPDGLYRAVVTTAAADAAGNRLASDYTWQFRVANAVFWSRNGDGLWEDRSNWSTGAVPGPNDVVFIESIAGDVTITHASGTSAIKSLVVGERVAIINSTLQVSDTIELHQPLTLNGGTLKGATVKQNAEARLNFDSNSGNTLDGVSMMGDLDLTASGARVLIRNGLSLSGSVRLDNEGVISFSGTQTFDTGQVIFAGNSGLLGIEPGTTLTLGPAVIVRGKSGRIGASMFFGLPGTRQLINQGMIAADVVGGTVSIVPTNFENPGTTECKDGGSVILEGESRNAGRINASGGGSLTVNGTWSNPGTITMSEAIVNLGGNVKLEDLGTINRTGGTVNVTGVLDLGGGTLVLDTTSGSWRMNSGTLKGGTVTQSGSGNLLFAGGGAVSTLDDVTVDGDLAVTNTSARVLIRNRLALTGSVVLDNESAISFSGTQTFQTGHVIFAGNSGVLGIEPGTTVTLGPAVIVRGKSGRIGASMFNLSGTRELINQGMIAADVAGGSLTITPTQFENPGTLECKNGGSVIFEGESRNPGRMNASSGGTLTVNGTRSNPGTITVNEATVNLGGTFTLTDLGTLNRTGGTVNLTGVLDLGSGTLTLDATTGSWVMNGGTLKGGTLVQNGGAKLMIASNAANTFDGVSVTGDLDLTNPGARLLIRNGLTLSGSVVLDNGGGISFVGNQMFAAGSIVFAGNSGSLGIANGTTLTLGPAMVVRGKTGLIGASVFTMAPGNLINQGLISADVAGGTLTINPTQFENPGTLRANGVGATILISVTPFTNTGTIQELNGGKIVTTP